MKKSFCGIGSGTFIKTGGLDGLGCSRTAKGVQ